MVFGAVCVYCRPMRAQQRRNRVLWAGGVAGGVVLLAGIAVWGGRQVVHGDAFRREIEQAIEDAWGGTGTLEPLRWSGMRLESDGYQGRGRPGSPIAGLRAEGIRIDLEPRGLLGRNLDIRDGEIQSFNMVWNSGRPSQGRLRDLRISFRSNAERLLVMGRDGDLIQPPLTPMTVKEVRLTLAGAEAEIEAVVLEGSDGSRFEAQGTVAERDGLDYLDAAAVLTGVPLAPYLASEWQKRVTGMADVRVVLEGPLDLPEAWILTGQASTRDAMIRSFPLMESISRFTGDAGLRELPLHTVHATFRAWEQRVQVEQFLAESEGTLRVEGTAEVQDGLLDGRFEVGVTPWVLHWLPGARERVFEIQRDGYFWTTMRVAGPLDAPRDDLTDRLLAAAKAELFDQPGKVIERGLEAVGKWFDSLLN